MAFVLAAGVPGLGNCLYAVTPYAKDDVVILERPLLIGEGLDQLPPLAVLAPLPREQTVVELPGSAAVIGLNGWPTDTAFEERHMGLLLAFIDAPLHIQKKVG